jgi:transcriptional regulator with XRE-family HTH domain
VTQPKRAAVDRTPQPCLHKVARHEHATRACYVLDRCRCIPCATANRVAERTRLRQTAYGRWQPYTDAEPVREHLQTLADASIGLKTVARRSGVSQGALWKLVYGTTKPDGTRSPSRRVRHATAAAILAVQPGPDTAAGRALVSAVGVRRRLRALVAAGWSQRKLAERLGILPGNFTGTIRRARCTAATVRSVRALYDELALTRPPEDTWRDRIAASRARNYAAARGWQPPLWWDEDWIDDPSFDPLFADELAAVDEEAVA